jgi:hypothetical protein
MMNVKPEDKKRAAICGLNAKKPKSKICFAKIYL